MEGRIALLLAVPLPVPFRRRRIQTVELFGIDVAGPIVLPGAAQGRPHVKVLPRRPPQKKRLFLKIGIPARALEKFLHRMVGRFQAHHLKLVEKRIHNGLSPPIVRPAQRLQPVAAHSPGNGPGRPRPTRGPGPSPPPGPYWAQWPSRIPAAWAHRWDCPPPR